MLKAGIFRFALAFFFALTGVILSSDIIFAQDTGDLLENAVDTSAELPGLVSGLSYLLGLLLGVSGIIKLKNHVENPGEGAGQTPLRTPMIRLLVGGALFTLPIVYEAMYSLISGGGDVSLDREGTVGEAITDFFNLFGMSEVTEFLPNVSGILNRIVQSLEDVPGFITALGYLLGLILGVTGLLKLKEHVENPEQTKLKEPVIRFIVGGAFFALPAIYQAMHDMVVVEGWLGSIEGVIGALGLVMSEWGGLFGILDLPFCLVGSSLGSSLCNIVINAGAFPAFLTALAYVIGLILGFWGILKLKDHVENPNQTSVWEAFSRFFAGGLFLALPVIVEVIRYSVTPITLAGSRAAQLAATTYNEDIGDCADPQGLDGALGCMMADLVFPLHIVLNLFTMTAGTILIMIAFSRLIKSAQEGPRGPGGIGTFMTAIAGGALLSYNELIRAFTATFGMGLLGLPMIDLPTTATYAEMQYTDGMEADEIQHAHTVISAVLKFMILLGMISFIRGIFIVRNVAEGNQQASMMAGITHLIGGALAVNIGPLMNAVQTTLGITGYGVTFCTEIIFICV